MMLSALASLLPARGRRRHFLLSALLALALAGCGQEDSAHFPPLSPDAVVLVIGDSLVAGTGAARGSAWPQRLADATGWQVINAGVPGDTSSDARRRLAQLLDSHRPDAVVIAVGGNDFLRDVPLADTRANLEAMIAASREVTEHVAVVAIPAKTLSATLLGRLSDHALFAELAQEHGLALVPGAVADVLSDPDLRADRIHANAAGYATIAQRVTQALDDHGWRGY
jgi:acyl-CoA thioesterase-1